MLVLVPNLLIIMLSTTNMITTNMAAMITKTTMTISMITTNNSRTITSRITDMTSSMTMANHHNQGRLLQVLNQQERKTI